jgi:hypothetical protein
MAKIRGKKTTSLIPYFLKSRGNFAHVMLWQEIRATTANQILLNDFGPAATTPRSIKKPTETPKSVLHVR